MLPAEGVLHAAKRWLELLTRSTVDQASALIRSDPAYRDLSITQYGSGLDWLRQVGLLTEDEHGFGLTSNTRRLSPEDANRLLFGLSLQAAVPPWLADADALVLAPSELPQDALDVASSLGLTEEAALLCVRQIHGHADLAERSRVGAAGEVALIELLEDFRLGSTDYVAARHDGYGYDIGFTTGTEQWHLEVKTTTRRARLQIHLSRHEYEVMQLDPSWRLVVVGLDGQDVAAIATVSSDVLRDRAPVDASSLSRWESARHELVASDLHEGLGFITETTGSSSEQFLMTGHRPGSFGKYAWMPRDRGDNPNGPTTPPRV